MSWHKEWAAISKTISEFSEICHEFITALSVDSSDPHSTIKTVILPMMEEIAHRIKLLGERYETQLPNSAREKITELSSAIPFQSGYADTGVTKKPAAIMYFSSLVRKFCSDFNYLTSDLEGIVIRLTERAFIHLQRSIIADESIRNKWREAITHHEPACEKLGAVHLLLHGIWSFKIDAAGERTDLVMGEPIKDKLLDDVYLSAEGLVLTEWKVATQSNVDSKCEEAKIQAKRYAGSSLAAIELRRYRYLVIISEDLLTNMPNVEEDSGILYKYINIAVNPSTPSVQARKSQ